MSETEREALEATTVDWGRELFSGMPDWDKFINYPNPTLTSDEEAFLEGPVEKLCSMLNDWEFTNTLKLPDSVWQFLKGERFFGMIIPKVYGGLEFSAYAHSEVIAKIASVSLSAATIVSVPNSLGPAELLLEYGTDDQKAHYLPLLAKGDEIPCFALTAPDAGSDASAIPDVGIVTKGIFNNEEIIGIKLNWDKRYISLAPIATLLGLAFKLYDPDHLIGARAEYGITCALIPTSLPGIEIGRRHFPLNAAFPNGPTCGKDVFIPLDWLIGGVEMAGHGWRMLIERLAIGRAISLPALVTGGSKTTVFATSAYCNIRKQFDTAIGGFEGVREALSRVIMNTCIMNAVRLFTVAAVDRGQMPAVPSAISKFHTTELGRKVVNDAMDIHGGKGICLGPNNYLGRGYQQTPIGITVEGANILTRSLIIFGQGVMRCHPYIYDEIQCLNRKDQVEAKKAFDSLLFSHLGLTLSNLVRAVTLTITRGYFSHAPQSPAKRWYQKLTCLSAQFALLTDIVLVTVGGKLKRMEYLSGRLADVISMLYLGSSVLKYYENTDMNEDDFDLMNACMLDILNEAEEKLISILRNYPNRLIASILRLVILPFGVRHHAPGDKIKNRIAEHALNLSGCVKSLFRGAYLPVNGDSIIAKIHEALTHCEQTAGLEWRLQKSIKEGKLAGIGREDQLERAVAAKMITLDEKTQLTALYKARRAVIDVDDFDLSEISSD